MSSPVKRLRRARTAEFIADEPKAMQQIVEFVVQGHGLNAFAQGMNMPLSSLHDWICRDVGRKAQYDAARTLGAASLVEKSVKVLDECERDENGQLTGPAVALVKAKSETLRWIAARLAPKDWGDRLELHGDPVAFDLKAVLALREARLMALDCTPITINQTALPAEVRARGEQLSPNEEGVER